jgi:hypothetical protein
MTPDERDRLARVEVQFQTIATDLHEMKDDVRALREQSNRWKGAFAVILGVGGIIGWAVSNAKHWFGF